MLLSTSTLAAIYNTLELDIMSNLVFYYERRSSKSACICYAQDADTFIIIMSNLVFYYEGFSGHQLPLKTILERC